MVLDVGLLYLDAQLLKLEVPFYLYLLTFTLHKDTYRIIEHYLFWVQYIGLFETDRRGEKRKLFMGSNI